MLGNIRGTGFVMVQRDRDFPAPTQVPFVEGVHYAPHRPRPTVPLAGRQVVAYDDWDATLHLVSRDYRRWTNASKYYMGVQVLHVTPRFVFQE